MRFVALSFLVFAYALPGLGATNSFPDLSALFHDYHGCFVLYGSRTDAYTRHNPAECAARYCPCSTPKVPHSLMALDRGVATGPDFPLPWQGTQRAILDLEWFIGCVPKNNRTVLFATRITGEHDATGKEASRISEEILTNLHL